MCGNEPRLGHLEAEPHHRAVGRVLLHRLEREGIVQEVDVVHQRGLLQPLARDEVPVRETVDDEGVARLGSEVEGLDRDPLRRELVRSAPVLDRAPGGRPAPRRRSASPPRCRARGRSGAGSAISRTGRGGGRAGRATRASRAGRRAPRGRPRLESPSPPATGRTVSCSRGRPSCPPTVLARRRAAS